MNAAAEGVIAERPAEWRSAALRRLKADGLVATVVMCVALAYVLVLDRLISTDGWLTLVAGRLVADEGLPSTNTLTVLGAGRPWVDQQWLGQLAVYATERLGGLRLVLFAHVVLVVAAFGFAAVVARRRGGRADVVAAVALAAWLPYVVATHTLRTQSLVYLPFAAVLAGVTSRAPVSWRRTLLLVAAIVPWANVHGSVLLAAGLVSLRGLLGLLRPETRRDPRMWILLAGPCVAVFASPYAADLPGYYADTLLNAGFANLTQWQPTTLSAGSAPLFVLAFGFAWMLGRSPRSVTTYEKLAGLALLVLALLAVRNWVWFALFALMTLSRGFAPETRARRARGTAGVNAALAAAAAVVLVATVATTASRPRSWFEAQFPEAAARAVAHAARDRPTATIYATERYGDWLLWKLPQLRGRIAYDARFELLNSDELETIALFRASPAFIEPTLRSHPIVVLDRRSEHRLVAALAARTKTLYAGRRVIVAER